MAASCQSRPGAAVRRARCRITSTLTLSLLLSGVPSSAQKALQLVQLAPQLARQPWQGQSQPAHPSPPSATKTRQPPARLAHQRFLAHRGAAPGPNLKERPAVTLQRTIRPTPAASPNISDPAVTTTAGSWAPAGPIAVSSQSFGLVTGRISSIALDPSDSTGNTVYIGSTGGGVWKSQNAAAGASVSFTPITDNQSSLAGFTTAGLSVGAVSVQPGGTGTILAGLGDPNDALDSYYGAGLLRSTNNGQSWTLITQTSDLETGLSTQDYAFRGEGFAGFAWSTSSPALVVAAVSQAYEATLVNATKSNASYQGLYYSTDSGATWHLATITDGSGSDVQGPADPFATPDGNAATAVVWNPIRQLFIAAVRFHGYYQSSDGKTFTRMANQPGLNLTVGNCPTESGSVGVAGCPIFRGALAVNPTTGDTFAWTVDDFNQDQGIWQDPCAVSGYGSAATCTNPTLTFANQLNTAALETTGEGGDATIPNGDYNLTLAAVPSQQDTLIFAGANDLYRCSIYSSCQWRDTTNSTSCLSAHVAPYQHAVAYSAANPLLLYLGNDSGLWRSTDAVGETGSPCSATDSSHFQNLNSALGSLSEVGSVSQSTTTASTLLAGLGANGASGIVNSPATAGDWNQILTGEGGPVEIDPSSSNNDWYVNNQTGVAIQHCSEPAGTLCTSTAFGTTAAVGESQVLDDGYGLVEPAPFTIDSLDTTQILIGTCRLWRGPKSGSGWSASNAISPILDGSSSTYDCTGNSLIRSIAALPTSTGETLYVGMMGANSGGGLAAGHLFTAALNTSGSVTSGWTDLTSSPVSNSTLPFNPVSEDISSLYIDPHDATGKTLYAAVSGFLTGSQTLQQLYRSINNGASWTDIASNLPNAPINAILVDPQDPGTVYLGTDLGVYITRTVTSCTTTNCWSPYGSDLPLVPITNLTSGSQTLTAATYGRGIWQIPLITAGTTLTAATVTPTSLTFPSTAVGSTSTAQTVTFKNSGSASLSMTSLAINGANPADFAIISSCATTAIAPNTTCTASITFAPTASGTRTATLAAAANISGGQLLIPLTGTATAPAGIALTPSSLTFGSIQVSTASSAQTVSVQNTGGQSISLTSLTVSAPFTRTTTTCGTTLAANTACIVTITFNPTTAGTFSGTLSVKDSLGTQTAALTGTALTGPTDTLSTTTLTFPNTALNTASAPLTVTLTNSGGEPLTNIGTSILNTANSMFSATSNCSSTLAANSSCTISVIFTPTATGSQLATLSVFDALHQQAVYLKGTGVNPPAFSLSKTALSFGSVQENLPSAVQTLTVTNSGGAPLNQPAFTFSGAGLTAFSTSATTCGATLTNGANCTVSIVFTPTAAGATSATLTVSTSTPGVVPITATLTGTGLIPPTISLSPASLNLGTVAVGYSSALISVLVTNSGQLSMSLPTFAVSNLSAGANAADFALSAPLDVTACTAALAPAAFCYIQVTFSPSVVGTETATLTATSTNAVPTSVSIPMSGVGTPPIVLTAAPASIEFGSLSVGLTSATQTVTISNTGRQAASGLQLSLSGPYAFASNSCTATLGIKASCTAQITFTPTASGDQPGLLTASVTNSGVPPATVSLDGTGLAVGGLTLSPTQMTFGSILVNSTSTAQTLTLTNSGQAAIAGLRLTLTGANYTLSGSTCATTLAVAASCTAQITFKPTSIAQFTGILSATSTSPGVSPASLTLTGYGIPSGALAAVPATLNFSSVIVGQTGAPQTVQLTNAGPALTGLSLALAGDYSLPSNTCGAQIATGASCTLTVTFSPGQAGTRIGSVTVNSTTSSYTPVVIGLTGTGLPAAELVVAPTSLAFGSIAVGANSTAQQLIVSNPGTGTLTSLGFTTAQPFTVGSGTCGNNLLPGGTCSVPVLFSPIVAGSQAGALVVTTSTIGINPVSVPLSGTGATPATLVLTPSSLSYPTTAVGSTSVTQSITVSNPGVSSLSGLTLALAGPFTLQSTTCSTTLAAAGTCTASIAFKPTVSGTANGFLTASSSTSGVATVTAALAGTGVTAAQLAITPSTVTFPATPVGSSTSAQTLTVSNTGQAAISDLALTLLPPFAIQSTTCTTALAGGATCTASILFSPTVSGSFTGSLTAGSALAKVTASANLTGSGTLAPGIVISPSTLIQFPTTSVSQPATPITVTVTNQGTSAALTGLSIGLDSTAAASGFAIAANNCLATLAATQSCTLQVSFTPTNYGALTGNLVFSSTNGGSTHLALSGFGFSFTFNAIGNPSATVLQGQTAYYTLAVTPEGGTSGAFSFTCSTLPSKALCIFNPSTLTGLRATGEVQLGISTGSPTPSAKTATLHATPRSYLPALATLFFLPALFLRRGFRKMRAILSILLITLTLTGLFACAGSGGTQNSGGESTNTGGTPTGTYPVTVTATSGGLSRTTQLTFIVN